MRRMLVAAALLLLPLLAACGSSTPSSSTPSAAASAGPASCQDPPSSIAASAAGAGQVGFEGVPIERGAEIGPQCTTQTSTVDGIRCGRTEQLAYHIHAHLALFVDGQPRSLPAGIGIPGSQTLLTSEGPVAAGGQCIYWLHTHAPDGIIHVESPTQRVYTLGNFFDEWHQPLSGTQVAGASGKVTAVVNGKPWTASPTAIPLLPHADIQLDVGSPAMPFQSMSWSGLGL